MVLPASSVRWVRRLLVVLGMAFLAAAALCVGGARSAGESGGVIAFVRDDGIYVMRPDGSGVHALKKGSGWFSTALAWSPDGQKLAAATHRAIWVMNADGGDAARVTPPVHSKFGVFVGWMSPSWSPDGKRIAYTFSSTAKADRNVWVMNADGRDKHRVTRTRDCSEMHVDWSATGQLVTTCVWGWGSRHLIVMNADGSGRHSLYIDTPPNGAYEPAWSPDGRRIAFAHFAAKGAAIEIIDADTGLVRYLVANGQVNVSPTWSPNGRQIAFARLGKTGGIYVINANGDGSKRLTTNGRFPAWQPAS